MKFLIFGILLLLGGVLAQEVCLMTSKDDPKECLYPARALSQSDLESLTILCKLSRGIFPFQPRGSMGRNRPTNRRFEDGLPHLEMQDSIFRYQYNFVFSDCDEGIQDRAKYFFWASKVDPQFAQHRLVGREFSADDQERNNTCIGIVEKTLEKINFTPIHRDDFLNQPKEPYSYDYLVVREPLKQTFNVSSVESSSETMQYPLDVGYFSYYNPSEYDQVVEVFLDTKHKVAYYFKSPHLMRTETVVNDQDRQIVYAGIEDFQPLYEKASYNVTILAYTAVTARIVGNMVKVQSEITATRENLFSQTPSVSDSESDISGSKVEFFLKDFHLADTQVHHTYEVMVLNYTTIYVALLCLGVVLVAGVLVFVVRFAIKRYRNTGNNSVPYQTLQANS